MATQPGITYEVLALRYGIFDGRMQYQNFIIPDDHAAPDPRSFRRHPVDPRADQARLGGAGGATSASAIRFPWWWT
jgi:hypothetical protein